MYMDRVQRIKEMLSSNPADSFLQHALALEYIKLGDDGGARVLFETILLRDPAYIGSYYHLGKLLERQQLYDEALQWYRQGMDKALGAGDRHAYNELRSALEELEED